MDLLDYTRTSPGSAVRYTAAFPTPSRIVHTSSFRMADWDEAEAADLAQPTSSMPSMPSYNEPRTSFGAELKDAFKPTDAWVAQNNAFLTDIREFYKERCAIEKEYSQKLSVLSKKYFERKAKKASVVSVGEEPRVTPGSLESATMTTWTNILGEVENLARERGRLSEELSLQIAEGLKGVQLKSEDMRKKHVTFAEKLLEDRDKIYSDLKKAKAKYDECCQSVESARRKQETATDSAKAQKHFHQYSLDMNNAKNTYIIAIRVANAAKQKYFHGDVPLVLDSMQNLSEARTRKVNELFTLAATLEIACYDRSKFHLENTVAAVARNDPVLDSTMFVKHNAGGWLEPAEFAFQPSPIWHDSDAIDTSDASKVYLRNLVGKSRGELRDMNATVEAKKREIEGLKNLRDAYTKTPSLGNGDEVAANLLESQRAVTILDSRRLALQIELDTVHAAVGDLDLNSAPHDFKSASFTIPTTCGFCQGTIWGLAKQGFVCRACGFACHAKCEMKVPASCPGQVVQKTSKKDKRKSKAAGAVSDGEEGPGTLSRTSTQSSVTNSVYSNIVNAARTPGSPRREIASPFGIGSIERSLPPAATSKQVQTARVNFAWQANDETELSVNEGDEVEVVVADDGSGWMTGRIGGREGVVPASYVTLNPPPSPAAAAAAPASTPGAAHSRTLSISSMASSLKKKGPAVAPKRGAKRLKYVKALYDYEAQTEVELSIREGDVILLVKEDQGDGWAEGEIGGVQGSFPANYVEAVDG
ncbi:hypothetical protein G7K_6430-t1 [Saitoella complicata NRRL Y-17804]|uniref:Protein BZZ1 n=1 Tax=Saitoella complicata (strain BCRC 22490 / CBS 7301 / JCM 7358 / NBRC 10748 / NRRL Y-17804) TaxID=698492 RepID=A0A0E9NR42_SAICN|nr:hypothetical protein G7K_6430-t1 [Saitoella complicata NRRL Y-17804]